MSAAMIRAIRAYGQLAAIGAMLMTAPAAEAAPKPDLWERWTAHDAASTTVIDHSAWDQLTRARVVKGAGGVSLVDYGAFTDAEKAALDGYVAGLSSVRVGGLNRDEQFAYWINLYNALTVKVILDHYPVESIRDIDISPGLFADGPWGAKLVTIEGEEVSLDDIEHRILRPIWRDPRIHYAVNCASIGCPDLRRGAFTSDLLEPALQQAAYSYINSPRGAQVVRGRLYVSSIYAWFDEDFGGNDAGVIAHLRQYADPGLKSRLERVTRIDDDDYNWALNDRARPVPAEAIERRNPFASGDTGGSRGGRGS